MVFEMGLSLPWHEPVLAKAVRTVYQRSAVIFQYIPLKAEQPLTQTSFSPSWTVCLVLSGGPTLVNRAVNGVFSPLSPLFSGEIFYSKKGVLICCAIINGGR